jgi:hypothetical protein
VYHISEESEQVNQIHENATEELVDNMISNAVGSDCSLERQDILTDLLRRFKSIISTGSHNLGKTSNIEHNIDTGDQPAVRSGLRRISFHEREQINKMLKNGIIERSDSPWASPVVLVKKKDDTVRFSIDERRLNAITRKDAYSLPRVDETLESLSGAKVFSSRQLDTGKSTWSKTIKLKLHSCLTQGYSSL